MNSSTSEQISLALAKMAKIPRKPKPIAPVPTQKPISLVSCKPTVPQIRLSRLLKIKYVQEENADEKKENKPLHRLMKMEAFENKTKKIEKEIVPLKKETKKIEEKPKKETQFPKKIANREEKEIKKIMDEEERMTEEFERMLIIEEKKMKTQINPKKEKETKEKKTIVKKEEKKTIKSEEKKENKSVKNTKQKKEIADSIEKFCEKWGHDCEKIKEGMKKFQAMTWDEIQAHEKIMTKRFKETCKRLDAKKKSV